MAQAGSTYDQILRHYYSDIELTAAPTSGSRD